MKRKGITICICIVCVCVLIVGVIFGVDSVSGVQVGDTRVFVQSFDLHDRMYELDQMIEKFPLNADMGEIRNARDARIKGKRAMLQFLGEDNLKSVLHYEVRWDSTEEIWWVRGENIFYNMYFYCYFMPNALIDENGKVLSVWMG